MNKLLINGMLYIPFIGMVYWLGMSIWFGSFSNLSVDLFLNDFMSNKYYIGVIFLIPIVLFVSYLLTLSGSNNVRDLPNKFGFKSEINGESEFDKLVNEDSDCYVFEAVKGKMDFDRYVNEKVNIEQYLGHEVDLERYDYNKIKIFKTLLEKVVNFDNSKYVDGKLYFGETKRGSYYGDLIKKKNLMVGGEAGAGKSGVLANYMMNMIVNVNNLNRLIIIDPKDGAEAMVWEFLENYFPNVDIYPKGDWDLFTDIDWKENLLYDLLKDLEYEAGLRSKYIKKHKKRFYADAGLEPIEVWVDEWSEINSIDKNRYRNDKEYKEKKDYILNTFEKWVRMWRFVGIKINLSTQRLSVENITGEMKANMNNGLLMRVQNSINGNMVIEESVYNKKLIGIDPTVFNVGRGILKYEEDIELIQTPYISDKVIEDLEKECESNFKVCKRPSVELKRRFRDIIEEYRNNEIDLEDIKLEDLEEKYLFNSVYDSDKLYLDKLEKRIKSGVEEEIVEEIVSNEGEEDLVKDLLNQRRILYERIRNSNMKKDRIKYYKDRLGICFEMIKERKNLHEVEKDLKVIEKELS